MEETQQETYQQEYAKFVREYNAMTVNGAQVGELIMRMSQYFSEWNIAKAKKDRAFSIQAAGIERSTDENGKAMSSAKAKVMADATVEAYEYNLAKAHVESIEQHLNSLKALQKGLLNEFQHMGN